jgi:hypothetical protein
MNLELTRSRAQNGFRVVLTDDQKAHRTRLHAEMVKNIVLHTIRLSEYERDEQIYKGKTDRRLDHLAFSDPIGCPSIAR